MFNDHTHDFRPRRPGARVMLCTHFGCSRWTWNPETVKQSEIITEVRAD